VLRNRDQGTGFRDQKNPLEFIRSRAISFAAPFIKMTKELC